MKYIARTGGKTEQGELESCAQHLMMVGVLCGAFSQPFHLLDDGVITGLTHDIGKYSRQFQDMIRGKNTRVDHSTIGAQILAHKNLILAPYAVMAHHSGLPNLGSQYDSVSNSTFYARIDRTSHSHHSVEPIVSQASQIYQDDFSSSADKNTNIFSRSGEEEKYISSDDRFDALFAGRMLFSSLVDADRLDAEFFTQGDKSDDGRPNPRPEWKDIARLTKQVRTFLDGRDFISQQEVTKAQQLATKFALSQSQEANNYLQELLQIQRNFNRKLSAHALLTPLNKERARLLEFALSKANHIPALFTLTAPTGSGKTNVSLSFALKHAVYNHQKRIIYVIPYMSIIDQTVSNFGKYLPKTMILPHYSEASFRLQDNEETKSIEDQALDAQRLNATENWNSPIIVTTAVQFFESLFSNSPAKCRKLHNIVDSVIIFDEAQTLPIDYLRPCVRAIDELVRHYGCSVILCTATQPALENIFSHVKPQLQNSLVSTEIAPAHFVEDPAFQRVTFRQCNEESNDYDSLIKRMMTYKQCLAIVNTRSEAVHIYKSLSQKMQKKDNDSSLFCLTTLLIPRDRKKQISQIRDRLSQGKMCFVVSTSLIEAGVDLDFPIVIREKAGLDSILQAAGRCNREGRRDASSSFVYVYSNSAASLPRYIRQNVAALDDVREMDSKKTLNSPDLIHAYFEDLYNLKDEGGLDKNSILEMSLKPDGFDYKNIASRFHLIDDDDRTVYIPVDSLSQQLCEKLKNADNLTSSDYRQLGQYSVALLGYNVQSLYRLGILQNCGDDYVLLDPSYYSAETGLRIEGLKPSGLFF